MRDRPRSFSGRGARRCLVSRLLLAAVMVILAVGGTAGASPPPRSGPPPKRVFSGMFGDVSVVPVRGLIDKPGTHGYARYCFTVANRSPDRPHWVTLTIPGEHHYYNGGDAITEISRTVDVGPGGSARVSLFQPHTPAVHGTGVGVAVDGWRQEDIVPLNISNSESWGYRPSYRWGPAPTDARLLVLAGWSVPQGLIDSGPGPSPEVELIKSMLPVSEWPEDWLAYSRYDGVVLIAEELRSAPPAVLDALTRYVETGGALTVLGQWPRPPAWKPYETTYPDRVEARPGFGRCTVYPAGLLASVPLGRQTECVAGWKAVNQSNQPPIQIAELNRQFPVVADAGVSVRGLFFMMIVFAVLIGPVNVFVLAKLKQRMWLLWTVPLISFLTSIGVFGTMLALEGWSATSRVTGLTILDEASHRAVTVGWVGFYSPLTPGDGLRFGYDTQVIPLNAMESYQGGLPRTIDWTTDQHLATGWVAARVPTFFAIRKGETRRERLAVRPGADGSVAVVNGLGADIVTLWYADKKGRLFTTASVKAGAQAVLTLSATTLLAPEGKVRRLDVSLTNSWPSEIARLSQLPNPRPYLKPDSYLAVLDGNPFIEEGLVGVGTRKASAVVLCLNRGDDGEN